MTKFSEGVTDFDHLVDTVFTTSSLGVPRELVASMLIQWCERCVEITVDGKLAGYALIINADGDRSFHGYKLIPGNEVKAFRVAKNLLKEYKDISITTTAEKYQVRRLGHLLGFNQETLKPGNIVCLKKPSNS